MKEGYPDRPIHVTACPDWFLSKVGATRNRPPYVIVLYKRQEAQNVGFGKKKKKKCRD